MTTTSNTRSERPRARNTGRRLGRFASWTLLLALIGTAVAVAILPALHGGRALTVLSQSMEPTLPLGSLVVVRPVPVAQIEVGDVVNFVDRDTATGATRLVTHRVIAIEPGPVFRTQGDNSPSPDQHPVRPDAVQGVMWYPVPLIGEAYAAITTPQGLLILGVGVFVVAVGALLTLGRKGGHSAT